MRERIDPATTEDDLFHGHRGLMETVPCACGTSVTAMRTDAQMVRLAVENHQRTVVHMAWWKSVEKRWH